MKKTTIHAFDFIRVFSTLGILVYHYSCHLTGSFRPLHIYANGNWGSMLVTVFFMLSGAVLFYHYSGRLNAASLGTYYYKRWKSIFPMYYLAYVFWEILESFRLGPFFRGNPLKYVFTLIGMDGYLSSVLPPNMVTYSIGEWYTGMIIVLYLLFPLILHLFEKSASVTLLASTALYCLTLDKPIINPEAYWSITSCLISFVFGMAYMRWRDKLLSPYSAVICTCGLSFLLFFPIPLSNNLCNHLSGLFLFIVLDASGSLLMKCRAIRSSFTQLSRFSFAVFLMHHITIVNTLNFFMPSGPVQILLLLAALIVFILLMSLALTRITSCIVRALDSIVMRRPRFLRSC